MEDGRFKSRKDVNKREGKYESSTKQMKNLEIVK